MTTPQEPRAQLLASKDAVEMRRTEQSQYVAKVLQSGKPVPTLAIVQMIDDLVIDTYVRAKKRYGASIGVQVDIHTIDQADAPEAINRLNADPNVHGIIVQLPIADTTQTQEILELVAPTKDVDGLRRDSPFIPATPQAIMRIAG